MENQLSQQQNAIYIMFIKKKKISINGEEPMSKNLKKKFDYKTKF